MKNTFISILIITLASCSNSATENHNQVDLDSLNKRAAALMFPYTFDSAELVLNRILELDPGNQDAISTLIQLYMFRGNYLLVFNYADSISRIHPNDYWMQVLMGISTEKLVNVDSAIYFYKRALEQLDNKSSKHKATLVTIVKRQPLSETQLDSIGETDQKIRNEITAYGQGGWLEIQGLGYSDPDPDFIGDFCYRLDTTMYWSQMDQYLSENGVNYSAARKQDDWFLICVKEKFKQRVTKLGLTRVDVPTKIN